MKNELGWGTLYPGVNCPWGQDTVTTVSDKPDWDILPKGKVSLETRYHVVSCYQEDKINRYTGSTFLAQTRLPKILRSLQCSWKDFIIWAPSSEFVSLSIPSWQILTVHAQPFRGARDLAFCLKVPLDSLLVWASSEGSGETARMRRLAWTFAAHIGDKYQICLTRSYDIASESVTTSCIKNDNPLVDLVCSLPGSVMCWCP